MTAVAVSALALSCAVAPPASARPMPRVVLTAHPRTVTAHVAAHRATASVTVKGRVTPVRAGRVVLQRKVGMVWADVGRSTLSGKATFTVVGTGLPVGKDILRVVKVAASHSPSIMSSAFRVTVLRPRAVVRQPPPAPVPLPTPAPVTTFPTPPPAPTAPEPPAPAYPMATPPVPVPDWHDLSRLQLGMGGRLGGYVGQPFPGAVSAFGGPADRGAAVSFSLDGPTPPGLTFDGSSGSLHGYPTAAGSYQLKVTARSGGSTASGSYTVLVVDPPRVVTASLPAGWVGQPYRQQLVVAGGYSPFTWYSQGGLPAGLTLGTDGWLTGTPTSHAVRSFSVGVSDGGEFFGWTDTSPAWSVGTVAITDGPLPSSPKTWRVPGDFASIQAAIRAADDGDTVLVAPGTYRENLDFEGKALQVVGEGGREVTTIDGGDRGTSPSDGGPVVSFVTGEPRQAVLRGFTLTHGYAWSGGGIDIASASPTIEDDAIVDNHALGSGGGISAVLGSPAITDNVISGNGERYGSGGLGGAGVFLDRTSAAVVSGNRITANDWGPQTPPNWSVVLEGTGTLMTGNEVSAGRGMDVLDLLVDGGFHQTVVDNAFVGAVELRYANVDFVNNSIGVSPDTRLSYGTYPSGLDLEYPTNKTVVANTVVLALGGAQPLSCDIIDPLDGAPLERPVLLHDKVWMSEAPLGAPPTPYDDCKGVFSAADGDSIGDPGLAAATEDNFYQGTVDLRPLAGSALVDAGTAPGLPLPVTDLAGSPRVVDGNHDGSAVVDIGAYEKQ